MITRDIQIRVRYYETDCMGIVHHSNYIRYYEVARTEMLREFGTTYRQMERDMLLPYADGDVLALPDDSRHALPAGSMGDMQLTVLRRTDAQTGAARVLRVTCYVFGRKIVFDVAAADA